MSYRIPHRFCPLVLMLGAIVLTGACAGGPAAPATLPAGSTPPLTGGTPSVEPPPGTSPGTEPGGGPLTVYSGRSEELVGPLLERFTGDTGIEVEVRYADTAELAATILEEGANSPADVFFAQDAGALGAVADEGLFRQLAAESLDRVEERFRSPVGLWVGVSGRARVAAYSTERVADEELPASILDFTDPAWQGRIGWAPTNGSFQAFVTALRVLEGDDAARAWLVGIQANEPQAYEGNSQALEGVAAGEVDVALINHYYLMRQLDEQGEDYPVANHFFEAGDPGSLVNVAGVGILATADDAAAAEAFVSYLLAEPAQEYLAEETFEYPVVDSVPADERLKPLAEIGSPDIDLSDLADLEGTLRLLQETGVL